MLLQLIQAELQAIPLLSHHKGALIDVVNHQVNGHLLVQPLHVFVIDEEVAYLVRVIINQDVLQFGASIATLQLQPFVLAEILLTIGLRLVVLEHQPTCWWPRLVSGSSGIPSTR